MNIKSKLMISFITILLAASCSSQKAEIMSLTASSQPLFTIGDEGSGHIIPGLVIWRVKMVLFMSGIK